MGKDSLSHILKNATYTKYHQVLENTSFGNSLKTKQTPIESFVGYLRSMAIIYAVIEREIRLKQNNVVMSVWNEKMGKYNLLKQDLLYFLPQWVKDVPNAIISSQELAKKIRIRNGLNPESILGYLYVLEGSTLGAREIHKDITLQFPFIQGKADNYLKCYGDKTYEKWMSFKQRIDSLGLDENQQKLILEASIEMYDGMVDIFQNLLPFEKEDLLYLSVCINPEAGGHPIPQDIRELKASIVAGEKCMFRFPYHNIRFGERGSKFAYSDSAWLATLAELSTDDVIKQVKWLKSVLSNRGVPSCMLQVHLEILHEELSQSVPEKLASYGKLKIAAQEISSFRQKYIDDKTFFSLSEKLTSELEKECFEKTGVSAPLLASAIIDEKANIGNALDNILKWIDNSQMHPIDDFQVYVRKVSSFIED